jgi:hypothetical protein
MHPAGARVLREDDQHEMNREAVLLQWERKIEQAERLPGRFERAAEHADEDARAKPEEHPPSVARAALLTEDPADDSPRRFAHAGATPNAGVTPTASRPALGSERRTITITGQPVPARRRRHSVVERQLAQPDRIALWAFLLGLFLVAVAAGTAHA